MAKGIKGLSLSDPLEDLDELITLEDHRIYSWDMLQHTKVPETTSFKLVGEGLENFTHDLLTI